MTRLFVALALVLASLTASLKAGDAYTWKSHDMKINGTSTLHDWTAPVGKMKATANLTVENGVLSAVNSMLVQVDVMSIKTEKGEDMEEKIYEALKAEEGHKTITFKLTSIKGIAKSGAGYKIEALGDMTIAGHRKNNVPMTVMATVAANGDVIFSGSQKITMTSYDMERPSAMLGMIKAGDDVTIVYTLTVKKA